MARLLTNCDPPRVFKRHARQQQGFTYLTILFAVAIMGASLAAAATIWHHAAQREKERQLLFIGNEFRTAIALYYQRTPGTIKRYPERLEQLLRDDRYLSMQRYLRKIYRDPITGKTEWGLIEAPGGGIMGVYSLSSDAPIKKAGFTEQHKGFAEAGGYVDWKFVYQPPTPVIFPPIR